MKKLFVVAMGIAILILIAGAFFPVQFNEFLTWARDLFATGGK